MNNIKNSLVFFISVIAIFLNCKVSYAYKTVNLFEEFINTTRSNVEEYGVETRFKTTINGQDLVNYFNGVINSKGYYKLSDCNEKDSYTFEFKKDKSKGFIIIENLNTKPYVTINITEKNNRNELKKLKMWVRNIKVGISQDKNIYYEYLRAKLPDNNLVKVNNELINLLKNERATNIDSIEINNGFTTCAYTYQYEPKRNNGKLIDFNYALSNYSSGAYITIGTPEIITTY